MSVPGWLNDARTFPNNENGAFNPHGDPSMTFMQNTTAASFDFNQLQQQRMQNGNVRNGSPAYHNPMYQTQPMIPSKRPRPREDSIGASPQQHPGALPISRSQTPQGPYQGFPGAVNNGQQFPAATSYQQFQQSATHANQSPVVQPQTFNPQASQQPIQTMSPSPFSPAAQTFASQASPPHSENGSRVNTPQNGAPVYAQGIPFSAVQGQNFNGPMNSTVNGAGMAQYSQHLQNQHQHQQHLRHQEARIRQMQQQQHEQQLQQQQQHEHQRQQQQQHQQQQNQQLHQQQQQQQQQQQHQPSPSLQHQQQRQQGGTSAPIGQSPSQVQSHQMAALRAQQAQQVQQRPNNPDQLLRTISQWAQQHGQPFNPSLNVAGRNVSCVQLFLTVMKQGGSKKITALGQWPNVASILQFNGPLNMAACQELQSYWAANLAGYEHFFGIQQQQRRAMADPSRTMNAIPGGEAVSRNDASPTKQTTGQPTPHSMQPPSHMQAPFQSPTKQMTPQPHDLRQSLHNGFPSPHQAQGSTRHSNQPDMPQSSARALPGAHLPMEDQRAPGSKAKGKILGGKENTWPAKKLVKERDFNFKSLVEVQDGETARTWGGIELQPLSPFVETIDNLLDFKLSVPRPEELGLIDLRTLTLSLRSGLHAEVRVALDTVASLSKDHSSQTPLILDRAEDLLETLIDCADDQVQFLADHSAEVSDEMLINSYEDTIRGCKVENMTLQEIPEFGTLEYNLDRAVDRLICITTILRNLSSSSDVNHVAIADPIVIRLMATVIRYIGTRSMLLRTHLNILDFSKDILTILSNVSQHIDLPGREEAFCVLHFLLSFAPSPTPSGTGVKEVTFASYHAGTHRYYPQAIDSFAKLLARGDPNRNIYKLLFAADSTSSPSFDLLTRAFGLAIAALPDMGDVNPGSLIKARLPYLLQGLLAAEILTSLIPSTEHQLARTWLASSDGFAVGLLRLVIELGKQPVPLPNQRHLQGRGIDPDPLGYATITERGFAILRRLTENAKDADGVSTDFPYDVLPDKRTVVGSLALPNQAPHIARHLYALSSLDT